METPEEDCEAHIPRNYQGKLIRVALERNSIIYLPTGSGKTFISVCVLKELAKEDFDKSYSEGGKISIMLVNTVTLVHQHSVYFSRFTPYKVGAYTGDMKVDFWDRDKWLKEYNKNQILVMTTAILNNTLSANVISLDRINLLILDECHHAVDSHVMRQVMMKFQDCIEQPRVLGLTATLLNSNPKITQVTNMVNSLETTLHAKVATFDEHSELFGYSTNPQEKVVVYNPPTPVSVLDWAADMCDKICDRIKNIPIVKTKINSRVSHLEYLEEKDDFGKYRKLVMDAKVHFEMLGVSGSTIALKCYIINLECEKRLVSDRVSLNVINSIITDFTEMLNRFEKHMSTMEPQHRLLGFASKKLVHLAGILLEYSLISKEELCGIVFVQRKNTAVFVHHFIDQLTKTFENMKHIKSDFIVGYNANPLLMTREALYNTKINKNVVDKFKSKEVNLLIASNVIEEGIDVPRCSLVVKFDTPTNYREYVQSKGRARHASSLYYIMVEKTNNKFFNKYHTFQQIEKELHDYLVGKNEFREGPDQEDIDKMYDEIPIYYVNGPGSANVTSVTAIPTLMNYCNSLNSDSYTCYEPEWFLEKRKDTIGFHYQVTIILPMTAAIIEPIKGDWKKSKRNAKRSAAMKTIIMLHKMGALNDSLVNVTKEEENEENLFSHWPKKDERTANDNIGATNKRRLYNKLIPKCVSEKIIPSKKMYLHIINLSPVTQPETTDCDSYALTELYQSDNCFGFITSNPLLNICKFPIYVSSGQINVSLDVNHSVMLNKNDVDDIRAFHHLVLADIVNIKHPFLCLSDESCKNMLMVPVIKSRRIVDLNTVRFYKSVKEINELTHDQKMNLEVDDEGYYRKIVCPWYRLEDIQYLVLRVCDEMRPKTPFPNDDFNSYEDYFTGKYNLKIHNQQQPLLYVKALSSRLNCLKPRGIAKKKKHDEGVDDLRIHLIPELCVKEEFPTSLWVQAKIMPSIMHRVLQLLRCEEFRSTVAREANLGSVTKDDWAPLELDSYLLNYEANLQNVDETKRGHESYTETLMEITQILDSTNLNKEYQSKINDTQYPWLSEAEPKDIKRNLDVTVLDIDCYVKFLFGNLKESDLESKPEPKQQLAIKYNRNYVHKKIELLCPKLGGFKGPELRDIYQAFCTAKSNDIVNYERLEMLGDSFLKFIGTLFIFVKYPKYNEGQATALKSRLVSNKNLYFLGCRKKVNQIIKSNDFSPKAEWLPPGYAVPKVLQECINDGRLCMSNLYYIDLNREEQITGKLSNETIQKINEEINNFEFGEDEQNADMALKCFKNDHSVGDKSIADSVEALIGVYFNCDGVQGALKFMEWLGLFPQSENVTNLLNSQIPDPIINPTADRSEMDVLLPPTTIRKLESIIGYTFKNKAFLLQAMTHSSYSRNRLTYSYERLEFIGDAVLDFLITTHIYESGARLDPGELTDLRSALVNNEVFASYVVRMGLHQHILHLNQKLLDNIGKFVEKQKIKDFSINDDVLILLNEDDLKLTENVDCPKALGDIFESIAGAIYLDSGMNLNKVWEVFHKIMWQEIEAFSKNVPKNPIRMLLEKVAPSQPKFYDPLECKNGNLLVKLVFMLNGVQTSVYGAGDNKKSAKRGAAKLALALLNATPSIHKAY